MASATILQNLIARLGQSQDERHPRELAPDFALPDLDGQVHTLSEQRGHPVVLAYFATW